MRDQHDLPMASTENTAWKKAGGSASFVEMSAPFGAATFPVLSISIYLVRVFFVFGGGRLSSFLLSGKRLVD